jgi:hypothetical protein
VRSLQTDSASSADGLVFLVSGACGREVSTQLRTGTSIIADVTEAVSALEDVRGLVDLTALDETDAPRAATSAQKLERVRDWIGPALKRGRALDVLQVTCCVQNVLDADCTKLNGAIELGLYRNLWAEYRACRSKTIDVEGFDAAAIAAIIATELGVPDGASEVAYRRGQRWVRDVRRVELEAAQGEMSVDVALITGGTGGIGLRLARELVKRGARALLLTGRSKLGAEREGQLAELRSFGVAVEVYQGDLTNDEALRECLHGFVSKHGELDCVYHLAGAVDRTTPAFFQKSAATLTRVFTPKVDALTALHQLLAAAPPKRCFLFSSISSVAPTLSTGILDYASANRYLDVFTRFQHALGNRFYTSVQWAAWRDTGLVRERREVHIGRELEPAACFSALWKLHSVSKLHSVVCLAANDEPALAASAWERPLPERSAPGRATITESNAHTAATRAQDACECAKHRRAAARIRRSETR